MIPIYSMIYASARPHLIAGVIKDWESKCRDVSRIEWCVVTDRLRYLAITEGGFKSKIITGCCKEPPHTRIRAYNEAAKLSTGHWLVTVADDWVPCDGWDEISNGLLPDNGDAWCVHVYDGHKGDLITHPILNRPFYQQQGYFLCPEYMAYYADAELTEVCIRDNERLFINPEEMEWEHKHPDFGTRPADAIDLRLTDAIKEQDRIVFERRKATGFPLVKV